MAPRRHSQVIETSWKRWLISTATSFSFLAYTGLASQVARILLREWLPDKIAIAVFMVLLIVPLSQLPDGKAIIGLIGRVLLAPFAKLASEFDEKEGT